MQSRTDLVYLVPPDAADAAEQLGAVLDEVDEHCRSGDMLTLVTPPDVSAYQRWFLGEFVRQIRDGVAPTPWRASDFAHNPAGSREGSAAASSGSPAVVVVHDDLDLEGAARLRPALVEVVEQGALRLTVDLAGCAFIDSVGISLLLTTQERLHHLGGFVTVTNASGATRRALEVTGVYDVLTSGG
jgi:anti-sigma B factor antagonist